MLVYPSGIDVSSSALRFLYTRLRQHRRAIGSRWRLLNPGRQALLALAHLQMGHTYAQLAAGFGIGTTTAYRYATEAVELLAGLAPTLADAIRVASTKALVILDGTLLPIDRVTANWPFYSGKHKKHGMNLQVFTDPSIGCCEPHRPCPAPSTMSALPASTASSTPLPRPTSSAGRTRRIGVPAEPSAPPTGAAGKPFQPVRRPSTGPTRRSGHSSSRPWPPSKPGGSFASSGARPPATSLVQAVLALHLASSE